MKLTGAAILVSRDMKSLQRPGDRERSSAEINCMLPVFKLLTPIDALKAPGSIIESEPHEKAAGATVHVYEIDSGRVLLTAWNGLLHEVIYQTPMEFEDESHRRNEMLFKHYGEGHEWNELLDNGFGKTYRRADMQRYSLWSYAMDFNTFGTMAFHEVKW